MIVVVCHGIKGLYIYLKFFIIFLYSITSIAIKTDNKRCYYFYY